MRRFETLQQENTSGFLPASGLSELDLSAELAGIDAEYKELVEELDLTTTAKDKERLRDTVSVKKWTHWDGDAQGTHQ